MTLTRTRLSRPPGAADLPPAVPPDNAAAPADRQTAAADQPAPAGTLKLKKISVKDPGINDIEAVSFLIPTGWKAEGGVRWFPDYFVLANLLMRISDPQSGAAIELLPIQHFTWINNPVIPMQPGSNYMGAVVARPVEDAAQFIHGFYMNGPLRHLRGARVVEVKDLDKVARQVAQAQGGQPSVRAARVRYTYDVQGRPWEEEVYVTLVYVPWQMGTAWHVSSAYAFRAPQGRLDQLTPVMTACISSIRLSLDWYGGYMYVQKLFLDRMQRGIEGAIAISDTVTQNSEEIRQMFRESHRKANASQDRISRSYSEYIRGVETYHNPFEERSIQLPGGYRDAWVSGRGEYLLSSDAGFNPNVGDTMEWRRMEVAP